MALKKRAKAAPAAAAVAPSYLKTSLTIRSDIPIRVDEYRLARKKQGKKQTLGEIYTEALDDFLTRAGY